MNELVASVEQLKSDEEVSALIKTRMEEFQSIKTSSRENIFKELCFCVMTANCGAEKCLEVHENIGNGFINYSEKKLAQKLKQFGYRFPNIRAKYIVENRPFIEALYELLKSEQSDKEKRAWIVKNIKGLGLKEGSHFLRNIGFLNCAIVDFHIVDLLVDYGLIQKPKTMTKTAYLEIECVLEQLALETHLCLADLDLYLWYMETGKILK
ncbi:MAG: N-glycosylase/DNA lyase [Candidatus Lokiarchaeota archaeon]|nr:N-glycosylase/DNA lyase [Candidatus Lokiarchaeota archaeon]